MNEYLFDFKNMDWESPRPGLRFKVHEKGGEKVRLVEFSEGFIENDWCIDEHKGYIIKGSLSIDFDGKSLPFREGDVFFIPEGEKNKHKPKLVKGEIALIILFEKTIEKQN